MIQNFVTVLFGDPFAVMNAVGLVAFALVGSSKAIREEFDLLGIVIIGLAMAFAGGRGRPATYSSPVFRLRYSLQSKLGWGCSVVVLAIGLNVALSAPETHPVTLVSDVIGIAAFATAGSIVASEFSVSAFGIVVIATINAVGGGVFADILLDRAPFILFEDFYASCAVLGGTAYWVAGVLGTDAETAAVACAVVILGTRLAAVTYRWNLPTAQSLKNLRD